jgi:hypothetical protein
MFSNATLSPNFAQLSSKAAKNAGIAVRVDVCGYSLRVVLMPDFLFHVKGRVGVGFLKEAQS